MQVLTSMVELSVEGEYGGTSPMLSGEETELLYRVASGDIEAKLQLVKQHLNLVVELAARYASVTGKPFSQMVQTGALAVVRAADNFHRDQNIEFTEHMKYEVVRAMEGINYL